MLWLAYHILQSRLCARIELSTLNLMAIFIGIIVWMKSSLDDERVRWAPWVLGLLMVAWFNLHAGFIYGLGLLVAFSIGARWGRENPRLVALIDRSLVLGLFGLLLNPFGPRVMEVFWQCFVDFGRYSPQFIEEWARPTLQRAPYFWGTLLVCWMLSVSLIVKKKKKSFFWIPAVFLFGLYGTRYWRASAVFAFTAVPFLIVAAKEVGVPRFFEGLAGRRTLMWWALCLIPLFVDRTFFLRSFPIHYVDESSYPIGACRFIEDKNIEGRLYNPLGFGGYIDWALGPQRKVLMDGRYFFFPLIAEEQRLMERYSRMKTKR
jgi:hypothetical protein